MGGERGVRGAFMFTKRLVEGGGEKRRSRRRRGFSMLWIEVLSRKID